MLECGMTDWPGYTSKVFKTLKPTGWLDLGEYIEDVLHSDDRPANPREDWSGSRQYGRAKSGRAWISMWGGTMLETWRNLGLWMCGGESTKCRIGRGQRRNCSASGTSFLSCGGSEHGKDKVERLGRGMLSNLREEEREYQVFCITIGRKP